MLQQERIAAAMLADHMPYLVVLEAVQQYVQVKGRHIVTD